MLALSRWSATIRRGISVRSSSCSSVPYASSVTALIVIVTPAYPGWAACPLRTGAEVSAFTEVGPRSGVVAPPLAGTLESRRRLQRHATKVERVARQLRQRPPGRPVSLDKGVVSHQVPKP